MQPNQLDLFGRRRDSTFDVPRRGSSDVITSPISASGGQRLRSEDSWIEISSQPSSSSLSSVGDNDIITTGLQIQRDVDAHRRRRFRPRTASLGAIRIPARPTSAAGSSQDEYDESESESDRMMSSSNEDIGTEQAGVLALPTIRLDQEDAEEENATSLGIGPASNSERNNAFTPQPNAFSHPPSSQAYESGRTSTPSSYFPPQPSSTILSSSHPNPSNRTVPQHNITHSRPRLSTAADPHASSAQPQPTQSHSPYNILAPSRNVQPDHDAALRASLSTLLSCAAAVRGSDKRPSSKSTRSNSHRQGPGAVEPATLRLVPESDLFASDEEVPPPPTREAKRTRASTSPAPASVAVSSPLPRHTAAAKRKARETSKDRHAKKSRATTIKQTTSLEETTISPTLMTWMISAGVVLVFSAISFSAGYAWGKEVGRIEASTGIGLDSQSCGREAMRGGSGLRKLRWGTASASVGM